MRRRQPTTFQRCLAVHMRAADRRSPKTTVGKIGHLIAGIVMGAVFASIVIEWFSSAPR